MVEVGLVQCNIEDNQYQQKSELLYTFMPNKSYAYLLNVQPSNFIFLETYNTELDAIVITFIDQNGSCYKWKIKLVCLLKNRNDTIFYRTKN